MSDYEETSADSDEWYNDYDIYDYHYDRSPKRRKTYPHQRIIPVIRTTAPALKDMANATVAISLWKHVNMMRTLTQVDDNCVRDSSSWSFLIRRVKDLTSKLLIPPPLAAKIHEYIDKVQKEITRWATYHFRSVFLNMTKDFVVYNYLSDLIWRCDGTIDYIETVKNISKSKSPIISEMEKYNFLCTYCLENEMQQMTSVLSNIFRFQDYADFGQHPLICYWNHYFSEKLNLMPKDEDEDENEDLSLDCTMFRHRYVDNWPAKEYFFDRLSSDDQVVNAIWLIDKLGTVYQKVLLMKLNESQRISVYLERSVQILMNYVRTGVNSMDVIMTWTEVRNLFTREQFVDLFASLLNARAPGSVLTEVWISVDFDFRNYFLNFDNYKFIQKILYSFEWTNDLNFVIIVLQDLNTDMKTHVTKQFFDNFCERLFSKRENLQGLDRFLDVYHDHAENSKQFKQHFVLNSRSIKNHCLKYYLSGDVEGFNNMLTYLFSQMTDRIPGYKRNLLMSLESRSTCVELLGSNIENLSKIIVDTLPTTDSQIEFRKNLVFSKLAIEKLKNLLFNKSLIKVKVIIDSFLTSDEDKKKLKKSLIVNSSDLLWNVFRHSDGPYLQSLLLFVFGDENHVKEFKKQISVDSVFNDMLEQIVPERVSKWSRIDLEPNSFDPLTRFLNWYFESPNAVKRYKLETIYSYSDIDVIVSLLRKRRQDEVERLKALMKWFFENDAAQIQKFNSTYKKLRIATIL